MFDSSNRTRQSSVGDRRVREHDTGSRRETARDSQRSSDRSVDRAERAPVSDVRGPGDNSRGDNGQRVNRNEEPSGLEGRWQRGQLMALAKRERSPDRDTQPPTKRSRVEGAARAGPAAAHGSFESRGNREGSRESNRGGDRSNVGYVRRGVQQRR